MLWNVWDMQEWEFLIYLTGFCVFIFMVAFVVENLLGRREAKWERLQGFFAAFCAVLAALTGSFCASWYILMRYGGFDEFFDIPQAVITGMLVPQILVTFVLGAQLSLLLCAPEKTNRMMSN